MSNPPAGLQWGRGNPFSEQQVGQRHPQHLFFSCPEQDPSASPPDLKSIQSSGCSNPQVGVGGIWVRDFMLPVCVLKNPLCLFSLIAYAIAQMAGLTGLGKLSSSQLPGGEDEQGGNWPLEQF